MSRMRTRSQNLLTIPTFAKSTVIGANFTWGDFSTGFLNWRQSAYQTGTSHEAGIDPLGGSVLLGNESTISDEIPKWERLGRVIHHVRSLPPVLTSRMGGAYWHCVNYAEASHPFGPYRFAPIVTQRITDYGPQLEAIRAAGEHDPVYNIRSADANTLPSGRAPSESDLVAKIMRRLVRFNGATYLAELRDLPTVVRFVRRYLKAAVTLTDKRMMRRAEKLVSSFVKAYSNGRWHSFADLPINERSEFLIQLFAKHGKDAYLGTLFGLMPTVGETVGLKRELASQREKRLKFTATDRVRSVFPADWTSSGYGICTEIAFTSTSHAVNVIGAHVRVRKDPYVSPGLSRLNTTIDQFLGYNPLRPLWARVPFSFMVDWFFGIDVILDAAYLATTTKLDIQWWRSSKSERSWIATARFPVDIVPGPVSNTDYAWIITPPQAETVFGSEQFTGRFSQYIREPISMPARSFIPKMPELPSMGKLFTLGLVGIGLFK